MHLSIPTTQKVSLPSWECGLKSEIDALNILMSDVAPFVGEWIEMFSKSHVPIFPSVAPFVGVWIEI